MVLVFSTSTGKARSEMMTGIREFAQGADWNIQLIESNGSPFPVRELLKFWSPIGCIAEISGNGVAAKAISRQAFGRTPVVYIGGDTRLTPRNAACVIHDAVATGEAAARELLALGLSNFAFLGVKGHAWSQRRKQAFAAALKLNGREMDSLDLPLDGKNIHPLKQWLAGLSKPCGLMAANDASAETVLATCRLLDIAVPDEIAVIGVDDDESICEHTVPTLSSVRPDFRQGGRFAARLLARKLHDPNRCPQETVFTISGIVHRGSTRLFKRKDAYVSNAMELIWGAEGIHLSSKDILSTFPCSRRGAEMRFRRVTGHSVLDELLKARVHLAKSLLNETSLPISAIAERCGYRSIAHFRDAFRKATGVNPLRWRSSAAETV